MLSFVLIFFGTLAQIDSGIWTVVNEYFRSAMVWIPLQLLVKFGQIFFGVPQSWTQCRQLPVSGRLAAWRTAADQPARRPRSAFQDDLEATPVSWSCTPASSF